MIAPAGAKFRVYRTLTEIESIAHAWDSFRTQEQRFIPSFAVTKKAFQESGLTFCFITIEDDCSINGIACFFNRRSAMNVSIRGRPLFGLPVRETRLCYSSVLGRINDLALKEVIRLAARECPFDLMVLAEMELASPLFGAVTALGKGLVPTRPAWQCSNHWLINLPSSFDEYLRSLRPSTTGEILRKIRAVERSGQFHLRIFTDATQVEQFLHDGEQICRRTYHWTVGQRLENDDQTRERFLGLAAEGRLRAYILYMDARPCAYARGEIFGTLYHSETPAFDPSFQKLSLGMVLLMWTIRDLIENTDCELYDFGPGDFGAGGEHANFKARFGNYHLDCVRVDICNLYAPYSLCLFVFQRTLFSAKRMLGLVLRMSALTQNLKKLTRRRSC